MKFKKLFLLASSLVLLGGCAGEFDKVKYPQDEEGPKITYINPSENGKEFTVGDEPYVITYDIGGRNGVDNKKVTLKTDNADIATIEATKVDNNDQAVKISPVGAGETNVYIISENNPDVKGTIKVKVNELPADAGVISLVALTPAQAELNIGESVVVHVNETNGNVVWSVQYGYDYFTLSEESNESVKVTAVKAGTACVRATVNGAYATQEITVKAEPVVKKVYFVNFKPWTNIKFIPFGGSAIPKTSTSNDEFGHPIYEFDIDETQYPSFKIGHDSIEEPAIKCSEFVHKNAIENSGSELHFFNYTAPVPSVSFGAETFSLVNGYSQTIHVSSYLGDVEYSIVSGASYISINNASSDNNGVNITGNSVGTSVLKAKIAGTSDPEIAATITVTVLTRPNPTTDWPNFTSIDEEDSIGFDYSVYYDFDDGEEIACPVTWAIISGGEHASVTYTDGRVTITGILHGNATLRAIYDLNTRSQDFNITINQIVKKTIYFTNNKCWSDVYVFAWYEGTPVKNAEFPGAKITSAPLYNNNFEQCYSFTFKEGLYDRVIFSNGSSDEQTIDIFIADFATHSANNVYLTDKGTKWEVGFATYTSAGSTNTVYLDIDSEHQTWEDANAKFFVYTWKADSPERKVFMYHVSGDVYAAAIPTGYSNVIFVRNNPDVQYMHWESDGNNGWWGQTVDLTYNSSTPQFKLTSYTNGTWGPHA